MIDTFRGEALENKTENSRNYELDLFRIIFIILIFFTHTSNFMKEEGSFLTYGKLGIWGGVSVHFFFMLSGLLMTDSISRRPVSENFGKAAIGFVLHKFKGIVWPLWTAIAIYVGGFTLYMAFTAPEDIIPMYVKIFPELFMVTNSGVMIEYLKLAWYISAMLICMLPLSYLLYIKRDFTVNVFAPLAAILTLGYMYQTCDGFFVDRLSYIGFFQGGLIRGFCGLCFGICSYSLCERFKRLNANRNMRVLLTVTEILLYVIFFGTLFFLPDNQAVMSVLFILPIAMAITFSGKSFLVKAFRWEKMRLLAPLSLYIYLDHGVAHAFVKILFSDRGWGFCAAMMALFTAVFCVLNGVVVYFGKRIWANRIVPFFTKPDNR